MKYIDTPESLIAKWDAMNPGLWSDLDLIRQSKESGPGWAKECTIPMGAAAAALVNRGENINTAERLSAEATACYLWQMSKIVYQLDATTAETFRAQALSMDEDKELPADYLLHLPYPCIYIDTGIYNGFVGFFAWIEWDISHKRYELRASWKFQGDNGTWPFMLHILPGKTLGECVEDTFSSAMQNANRMPGELIEVPKQVHKEAFEHSLFAAQVILYLNSIDADVYRITPTPKKRGKKKAGGKAANKQQPTIYELGMRIGAALRMASRQPATAASAGTGSPKRPHARRGHWHHYWTGPRDGDRTLLLKWIPPTFIHPEAGRKDNVVVFPVKDVK